MKTDPSTDRAKQLTQAFVTFNALSSKLDRSYRDLEIQVATLNQQLEAARKDRQRQKDEKERLAERLSRLLGALPAGVVVLDSTGRIQDSNPCARDLFGEDIAGLAWDGVLKSHCRSSAHSDNEYVLNSSKRIALTENLLPQAEGKIVLITDITERRELEFRLARKTRLSEMGETTARLAHQIRTPLASVMLYVSQLRKDFVSHEARKRYSEKIIARLSDLEMLVNDMLCFARGNKGLEVAIKPSSLLKEVKQALKPRCDTEHRIRLSDSTKGLIVRGNRHALLGALLNLSNNALEASGTDGQIEIGCIRGDDSKIHFFVRDDGAGVDAAIRDRIFEPFFTTRSAGTGLGLAVVKSVASAHGGSAWVEACKSGGSVFYLSVCAERSQPDQRQPKKIEPRVIPDCVGIVQ